MLGHFYKFSTNEYIKFFRRDLFSPLAIFFQCFRSHLSFSPCLFLQLFEGFSVRIAFRNNPYFGGAAQTVSISILEVCYPCVASLSDVRHNQLMF